MTSTTSPLTSAIYQAEHEAVVIANLEAKGYSIVMVESL